jgi:glycosyltransferase involved in cell wall biosynthesis
VIEDSGVSSAVRLTGYLDEQAVSGLLFAADVVALPFTYGLSFKSGSLLAALAHGRAVVGTAARIPDPDLRPGEHVLTVPPRDALALAEALRRLLDQPCLRARLAQAAQAAARSFSWASIAERHRALYAALVAQQRTPRR